MASARSYAAGSFLLRLDGVDCGFVLGVVRSEPLTSAFDLSLHTSVYDWIGRLWKGAFERHDLSVVSVDAALKPVAERELFQTLVTEVTIPTLDAAAKDPAHLTVVFAAEYTRTRKAAGSAVKLPAAKQKQWLPADFRLSIDGLDCSRVGKIDAFTVKQKVAENAVGEVRDYAKQAATLEFPPLRVTLAESHAQTWVHWHDDFVVKGRNDDTQERSGTLELLAPNA